jgi:Uri superfamily endonuclease
MMELLGLAGTYAFSFMLPEAVKASIGRLGRLDFPAGDYIYLGSARGRGGLRARLGRHLRSVKATHWHIDYLRPYLEIRAIGYLPGNDNLECAWSQSLAGLPAARLPAPGFGASDCVRGCTAHLVAFPAGESPLPAALEAWRVQWIWLDGSQLASDGDSYPIY